MNRTTLILGVVAAALAAFILLFERDSLSTGEVAMREGRVLTRFVRDKVNRLEIEQDDRRVVLEREPDPDFGGQLGVWKLLEPVVGPADDAAVNALLGELEWMDARRRLEGLSDKDRTEFGLETPSVTVRYRVAGEELGLLVGDLSPMSDGHYVQADDPSQAFVVGKDLFEALNQEPMHYHSKELHQGGLYLPSTKWIELTHDGQLQRFDREGDKEGDEKDERFWLTKPTRGWASDAALEALLKGFEELKGRRYVAPADSDRAAYGLDQPTVLLSVHKRTLIEEDGKDDRFEDRTFHFRMGAPCEQAGERYFQAEGHPVFCVVEAELNGALEAAAQPREGRLLPLSVDAIGTIEIREGDRRLTVERRAAAEDTAKGDADAGERYHYTLTSGGKALREGGADDESVRAWIAFLSAAEAQAFDQGQAQGPMRAAQITVRVSGTQDPNQDATEGDADDTQAPLELAIYEGAQQDQVLVRRGDEPQLLAFSRSVLTPLHASAAPFRTRKLLDRKAGDLRSVSIVRAGAPTLTETLVRGEDGRLSLAGPVAFPADSVVTQELSRLLSGLSAVQFISDAAAPEHKLDGTPAQRVRFELVSDAGSTSSHDLRIGAVAEGLSGRFARLDDDPAVFLVPEQVALLVETPLVSRVALAVALEDVERLEIKAASGGCVVQASASPGRFAFDGQPVSPEARNLVEALATLRAEAVTGYGTPTTAADTEVLVTDKSGQTHRVLLAAPAPDGRILARRPTDPVGFWLNSQAVAALTTCPTP